MWYSWLFIVGAYSGRYAISVRSGKPFLYLASVRAGRTETGMRAARRPPVCRHRHAAATLLHRIKQYVLCSQ